MKNLEQAQQLLDENRHYYDQFLTGQENMETLFYRAEDAIKIAAIPNVIYKNYKYGYINVSLGVFPLAVLTQCLDKTYHISLNDNNVVRSQDEFNGTLDECKEQILKLLNDE